MHPEAYLFWTTSGRFFTLWLSKGNLIQQPKQTEVVNADVLWMK